MRADYLYNLNPKKDRKLTAYFCVLFFSILSIMALLAFIKPNFVKKFRIEFNKEKQRTYASWKQKHSQYLSKTMKPDFSLSLKASLELLLERALLKLASEIKLDTNSLQKVRENIAALELESIREESFGGLRLHSRYGKELSGTLCSGPYRIS